MDKSAFQRMKKAVSILHIIDMGTNTAGSLIADIGPYIQIVNE